MRSGRSAPSRAERVVFAVNLAVVTALLGALVWTWSQPDRTARPTVVDVSVARIDQEHRSYSADVRNTGNRASLAVQISATGSDGAALGDQTIDRLSGGEAVTVVFALPSDERDVTIEVTSWTEP